jgi:L-amino acid N-acyltransferase YncA
MFSVARHYVYSRSLDDAPTTPRLRDGLTLRVVDYSSSLGSTPWSQTRAEWYREWHSAGAQCWLGCQADQPVFKAWVAHAPPLIATVVPWASAALRPGYVFDVETRNSFRRKGLANAFLRELLRRSHVQGTDRMYARVLPDNEASNRLFLELGFLRDGTLTELACFGRRVLWRRT